MTNQERQLLKVVKRDFKKYKQSPSYRNDRDNIIRSIIDSPIPNWGSISLKVV